MKQVLQSVFAITRMRLFAKRMKKHITSVAVATGFALICASPVAFGEEEENLNASDVPTVVQQAAEKVASGGKIVRWEKEGTNYEAVIEMNGKEWGYKFDAHGKMKGRHEESTEKGEKDEH
jgi:hypothetical protein